MDRLFRALLPLYRAIARLPLAFVAAGLALAALAGVYARHLSIDSDLANLLPHDFPSVQALERLRETVGSEAEAAVAIRSPDPAASVRFAEAMIPQAMALRDRDGTPFFARYEFRRDTRFMQRNALYFATDAELDTLTASLRQLGERARLKANPFYFDLDEGTPEKIDDGRQLLRDNYDRIVGKTLLFSPDSSVLVVRFFPEATGSVARIDRLYARLDSLLGAMRPTSYAPGMQAVSAGRLLLTSTELHAITDDVARSFGSGVALVLAIVVVYFAAKSYRTRARRRFDGRALLAEVVRAPVLALVITLPLLASLAWTAGLTERVFGSLNLMTSTLGLVLFGMGIDFGIHYYTRYVEERRAGKSPQDATVATLSSTGEAITTTALTTALAFFLFMIADFRGFSEFGFIAGAGILFALVAMLVLLPALLVVFERLRLLNLGANEDGPAATEERGDAERADGLSGRPVAPRIRHAGLWIAAWTVAVLAALALVPKLRFEYNMSRLEPTYESYEARSALLRQAFSNYGRRNPAYFVVDDPAEVPALAAAIEQRRAEKGAASTVGFVETLQARFPQTPEAQRQRLTRLDSLRAALDDPFLQAGEDGQPDEDLTLLRAAASTTAPVPLDSIPEDIRRTFTAKDGTLGRFLVVYPRSDLTLSDGRVSMRFQDEVGRVEANGKTYYAGSTSLIAADMMRLMREEAPLMVALALALVILFKWLSLRSWKWAAVSLVPLVAGFVLTFGAMVIFGWRLNFYNLVVLPALLGIGDDAGIHLTHRYLEEGAGSMPRVRRATGQAVLVSGLTTTVGFGGQILSFHPGLRSIGEVAGVGIVLTVLAALLFLPALVQAIEDKALARLRLPTSWRREDRVAAEARVAEALVQPDPEAPSAEERS